MTGIRSCAAEVTAFNAFNHPSFGQPDSNPGDSNFGLAGRNRSTRVCRAETHATRARLHHDGSVWKCFGLGKTQTQSANRATPFEKVCHSAGLHSKTRKFRKTSGFLKSRDRSEIPERNRAWDAELGFLLPSLLTNNKGYAVESSLSW
jgi:hypothetical protein